MRKVLVCGGRSFSDRSLVFKVLDDLLMNEEEGNIFIIHGMADGADALADDWAIMRGCPVARVPAHWQFYSKSAGPRRNAWMLELKPDLVIAFPGGAGTQNMISQAQTKNIPVRIVSP